MAYTFEVHWINRLDQMGATNMDCVITCLDGPIPEKRISKNWQVANYLDIDSAFLESAAIDEIALIIDDWEAENG